jgi:hypothetical protein
MTLNYAELTYYFCILHNIEGTDVLGMIMLVGKSVLLNFCMLTLLTDNTVCFSFLSFLLSSFLFCIISLFLFFVDDD